MAKISVHNLQPTGHGFFADSESYLAEFSSGSEVDLELTRVRGGASITVTVLYAWGGFTYWYNHC